MLCLETDWSWHYFIQILTLNVTKIHIILYLSLYSLSVCVFLSKLTPFRFLAFSIEGLLSNTPLFHTVELVYQDGGSIYRTQPINQVFLWKHIISSRFQGTLTTKKMVKKTPNGSLLPLKTVNNKNKNSWNIDCGCSNMFRSGVIPQTWSSAVIRKLPSGKFNQSVNKKYISTR